MDRIQYNFTDPNSTLEMAVALQDNGSEKIGDERIVAAFIAAAAKISELYIADARSPWAEYRRAIDTFTTVLTQEIFNDPNSDAILKSAICSPDGGKEP